MRHLLKRWKRLGCEPVHNNLRGHGEHGGAITWVCNNPHQIVIIGGLTVTWCAGKKMYVRKISLSRVICAAFTVGCLLAAFLFASVGRAEDFTLETARPAAEKGDAKAQYFLAKCYARGNGVPQDYTQAAGFLRKAAEQGFAYAQTDLAALYTKGQGVKTDLTEAFKWYRKAAEQGDSLAQYGVGIAYCNGRGVANSTNEAKKWLLKAAEQNQVEAQNTLGQLFFQGAEAGTNRIGDFAESAKWLRKAAEQGYMESMNNLGFLCEHGLGVKLDYTEAVKWYRIAAENGNAKAQGNLATLYEEGNGVPHDFVQAYVWFKLSARQGDAVGRRYVEDYLAHERLTPEELEKADKQVAEFIATHTKQKLQLAK